MFEIIWFYQELYIFQSKRMIGYDFACIFIDFRSEKAEQKSNQMLTRFRHKSIEDVQFFVGSFPTLHYGLREPFKNYLADFLR